MKAEIKIYCRLFDCLQLHEQFFSYLETVAIAGDRAASLMLSTRV
jgi:hypothetical protein